MPSSHGYWGRLRAASKMSVGTTGFAVETKLVSLSFFFFWSLFVCFPSSVTSLRLVESHLSCR